jgi:hypothetical protein
MKTLLAAIFAAMLIAAVAACGSSSSGSGGAAAGDPKALAGTWAGTIGDGITVEAMSLTVDSSGNITYISSSTIVAPGVTATIAGVAGHPTFFTVSFSNGDVAGFMTDGALGHVFFVTYSLVRGSLQNGASPPPGTYALSDLNGSWSGTFAQLDASLNLSASGTASATANSGTISNGSNSAGVTFSGSVTCVASSCTSYGAYGGSFADSTVAAGSLEIYMTPDKSFVGSLACDSGFVAADNCGYNMWTK